MHWFCGVPWLIFGVFDFDGHYSISGISSAFGLRLAAAGGLGGSFASHGPLTVLSVLGPTDLVKPLYTILIPFRTMSTVSDEQNNVELVANGTHSPAVLLGQNGTSHVSGFEAAAIPEVVRIRGPGDMMHVKDFVRLHHGRAFRRLEQTWTEEPSLNSDGCEYLKKVRNQPVPFDAHRYVLLGLFLIVVFLRGCTYWGWNGLQDMLYKSGAFAWNCDISDPDITYQKVGRELYVDCPERKNAINDLYTAAFAANFIFSAAGGVILDRIGPKLTLFGAILVDATGWALLAGASENFVSYLPSLVFIGMAADPGYLSLICVANLFPKKESTVMGVMGSMRSLSFAIPIIMSEVFRSQNIAPDELWKVVLVYILVGLGTCMAICVFLVPGKTFLGAEDFRRMDREEQVKLMRQKLLSSIPAYFFFFWTDSINEQGNGTHRRAERYKLLLTKEEFDEVTSVFVEVEKQEAKMKQEWTLWTALLSPIFLFLLPIFVVNLLRVEFYTKSNKEQLALPDGTNLYTLFSVMNILSFLPGPLMGYFSDRLGILAVLTFLNCAGIGMYAFVMPINLTTKGVSIFFFWLYASFVLSSVYCYIKMRFPNKLFGSLAGICSLVGGCFALTSIGWYKLSTDTLLSLKPKNFWPVDVVMIGGGILVFVFLAALFNLERKSKKRIRAWPEDKPSDISGAELVGITSHPSDHTESVDDRGGGTIGVESNNDG